MDYSAYLHLGFNKLTNKKILIDAVCFDCVCDHIQQTNGRDYGNQMEDVCSVTLKNTDLPLPPRSYLKKIVTIDGQTFEVVGISKGNATSTLSLITTNKR